MPKLTKEGSKYVVAPQQRRNIIRLYLEGESMQTIASLYGVSRRVITDRLVKWGAHVPKRKARVTPLNEDYFAPPHTAESMYWAGMLLADGSIASAGQKQACIKLGLSDPQHYMVQRFKYDLASGYAIVVTEEGREHSQGCRAKEAWEHKIYSDEMAADIAEHFGILPNKTGKERVIQKVMDHEHSRHFMRGLFDGDGHVHKTKNTIKLTAGSDSARADLENYFGFRWGCCRQERDGGGGVWYQMYVTGNRARMVAQHLYGDLIPGEHRYVSYKRRRAQRIIASGPIPAFGTKLV